MKCFILEGPETRAITSRYSATGKTTKFLFSGLVDQDCQPHTISTFKEDFKNRLVPGSNYKLLSTTHNQYGYELLSIINCYAGDADRSLSDTEPKAGARGLLQTNTPGPQRVICCGEWEENLHRASGGHFELFSIHFEISNSRLNQGKVS